MPTLYLTHRARRLRLEDGGIVVDSEDDAGAERSDRILLKDVDRVVVAGSPHLTIPALKAFCRAGVPLTLVSEKGRWIGELSGACDKKTPRNASPNTGAPSKANPPPCDSPAPRSPRKSPTSDTFSAASPRVPAEWTNARRR